MKILTLENIAFELDAIPEEVEELQFCVLDNSDPNDPDYFFIPLIFLESYTAPALVLNVGGNIIKAPIDWQILIGEATHGDLEVIPLSSFNDRGFDAFLMNPLTSFRPSYAPIEIIDIYTEVTWFFPKLRPGQLLCVPVNDDPKPECAYFVRDVSRQSEIVDIGKVW